MPLRFELCKVSRKHYLMYRCIYTDKCMSIYLHGLPGGASGKESACQCRRLQRCRSDPWVKKIPWRRAQQPTPVFFLGESNGQRSLMGYGPQGHKESDMTKATQHSTIQHNCPHLQNIYNSAFSSNGWNSSQSFLKYSSQTRVLKSLACSELSTVSKHF